MGEVHEHQRHYGPAGWLSPAPFERKQWTTDQGAPLASSQFPPADWRPVVTEETDEEGWIYSTSFDHLDHAREGGRACKRSTDCVRRRKWTFARAMTETDDAVKSEAPKGGKSVDVGRGLHQFMTLLSEIGTRRHVWEYLPWDPIAWLLIHAEHQEYLSSFELLQLKLNECLTENKEDTSLLNDLELATVASQAAYGYAMAAGHLDTIENFIAMHVIHVQYFDPVAGASVDANLDAVRRCTGYPKEDIVAYDWSNREFRPCYFIALDRKRERIVLAVRGSMEKGDLVTDVSGAPLAVEVAGISGKVHEGSMAAAIYIHSKTASLLKDLIDRYPHWSIFITGHSIGGGVAALVAMLLKFEDRLWSDVGRIKCISVGSAAVMSENLGELCKDFVTSLIFRYDVIPRLSAYSIEAMMIELVQASPAKRTVDAVLQSASSAVRSVRHRWNQFVEKSNSVPIPRVEDLHDVRRLAEDEVAVRNARRAVERLDEGRGVQGETSRISVSRADRCGPVRSFVPLYPPGKVIWLLGSRKEEREGGEHWWGSLHHWSMETIEAVQKTTTYRWMKEKMSKDVSWLKDWMKDFKDERKSDPVGCDLNERTLTEMRSLSMSVGKGEGQPTGGVMSRDASNDDREANKRTILEASGEASGDTPVGYPDSNERTFPSDDPSISKTNGERTHLKKGKEEKMTLMLIEAERKTFGRLLLHPMMMQDHLPRSYSEAVKGLKNEKLKR